MFTGLLSSPQVLNHWHQQLWQDGELSDQLQLCSSPRPPTKVGDRSKAEKLLAKFLKPKPSIKQSQHVMKMFKIFRLCSNMLIFDCGTFSHTACTLRKEIPVH